MWRIQRLAARCTPRSRSGTIGSACELAQTSIFRRRVRNSFQTARGCPVEWHGGRHSRRRRCILRARADANAWARGAHSTIGLSARRGGGGGHWWRKVGRQSGVGRSSTGQFFTPLAGFKTRRSKNVYCRSKTNYIVNRISSYRWES